MPRYSPPRYFAGYATRLPPPALAAEGIVLRRPVPGDVPWIVAACSDRELSRYIPGIPYPYSQSDARAFIEDADRGWAGGSHAAFVIAHATGGDGLGTIGLHLSADDAGLAAVGYWLRREPRGQLGPDPRINQPGIHPQRQHEVPLIK